VNDFKKDYYKILGLSPFATIQEVKLAFRKQVKKYHPDLHPGETKYEELTKEINEANGVLGNKDEKFAYDKYLLYKEIKVAAEEKENKTEKSKNKRTYTKVVVVKTEHFIYLKGNITIKYKGVTDEKLSIDILKETFYKIKPTVINATILESDMYSATLVSSEFLNIIKNKNNYQFKTPEIVNCEIHSHNGVNHYKLEIQELTIPKFDIDKVTKYESESFGVLNGEFYGYTKKVETEEKEIIVSECYGETGKKEEKFEKSIRYFRKQYYHTDCSTYWGNWVANIPTDTKTPTGRERKKGDYVSKEYYKSDFKSTYWGQWIYNKPIINSGSGFGCLSIIPQIFVLGFYLFFILSIIKSCQNNKVESVRTTIPKKPRLIVTDNNKPRKANNEAVLDNRSEKSLRDTFILNSLAWKDYDGRMYEGSFGVKKSVYDASHYFKSNLNIIPRNENDYDRIIYTLKEHDKNDLNSLYLLFDSLQNTHQLSKKLFAEMIVSFVQTIPYTLILPKSCDASLYDDRFTVQYLQSKNAQCQGNERFGINTPVEFLGNLDGDCDTRTLLLYTVLAHYGYDVVVLSSEHYGHSIIGINLPYNGASYPYNNQKYVFWETTAPNIRPGYLPTEISNTNYWRISLKSF
jgi:hypothetical protein